jgi:integrase
MLPSCYLGHERIIDQLVRGVGMGWVQRRELKGKGRSRYSYRAGFRDPDGGIKTKQFRRAHDAEAWLREQEVALHLNEYVDPKLGQETFGTFFDYTLRTGSLRPKTLESYRAQARNHILPEWETRPINRIGPKDVKELLAGLRSKPATANAVHRVIRRTMQVAVDEGRLARNPASRVKVPKVEPRSIRFLTADELASLADEVPERHRALVLVLGYGGLRIGEASALRVGDVDPARGRLTIERSAVEVDGKIVVGPTKTARVRSVMLPASVRDVLVEHIARYSDPKDPTALVFTGERGKPIRATLFGRRVIRPAAAVAGISPPPRTHDLRHTAVALAISAGWHPKAIQELAGHSSINVTFDVYGHMFETLQATGLERLDEIARAARTPKDADVVDLAQRSS